MGSVPALGKLLDPVSGCLANAESVNKDFSDTYEFPGIKGKATVWFDDRLVPHIHAGTEHDVYFLQGYIHAGFRLWQMDMQTRAAAGRVSEAVGEQAFEFDRRQRRKGMVYAAENSLKASEADDRTRRMLDAYTEGVNNYISSISYRDYPLEYKLMGFAPEPWTNLKSILLLKYMADDLTGKTDDIAHSYLRHLLLPDNYNLLFPDKIAGSTPVIPAGTEYPPASLATPVAPDDKVAFPDYASTDFGYGREDGKGSNNWAVSGSRTASGAAILCNDPHLALNLPSLWYETQLQTPGMNVYGASLPGAPGVIIGFNDSLSWGLTNNYRDVKDFYEIKPVKGTDNKYWFAGKELPYIMRSERIVIKGKPDFTDAVKYTIHGPLIYDEHYNEKGSLKRPLAMCWMGHKGSNEILAIYKLNRARNYDEFVSAILHFECPAQNMIYADRAGNIALWGQGQFVNKWRNQGEFVMNGWDSSTLWKELIPMRENPHTLNPAQGFLSSANQCVTDDKYPYWYNGDYVEIRAWRINQALADMPKATIEDMFALQNDDYSILAGNVLPLLLDYCKTVTGNKYLDTLRKWDGRLEANSIAGSVFQLWWRNLYMGIWNDDFGYAPDHLAPLPERTMQLMVSDPALKYYDNRTTPQKETLRDIVLQSLTKTTDSLNRRAAKESLVWYKAKKTSVTHLAKLPAFSYTALPTGGWGNTVNAMKNNHGPSWRMVVQMGHEIEAYGVYPGGQSGNPGSKHYADYLQHWVDGEYYRLLFLPNLSSQQSDRVKYTWQIKPE
jgi:penicillin amidase